MSKVGQWVLEMQEDASWMSRPVFVRVHGITQADVWDQVNDPDYYEAMEPDLDGYEAMREGYHG